MNTLQMVYNLRNTIEADYNKLIEQADALEALPDSNGKKHAAALNDRCDTLLNQLYLLERAIKKYGRRTKEHADDTFSGIIDKLQKEPEYVRALGRQTELERLAADKWTETIGYELHEYEDGSIDPVILNHESAKRHYDRAKENERTR